MRALLLAGADLHVRDTRGATALMHAAGYRDNLALIELLVDAGIDLEAQDDDDWSALLWAAALSTTPEVVELLHDLGANASHANHAGETAWDLVQDNRALQGTSAYLLLRPSEPTSSGR